MDMHMGTLMDGWLTAFFILSFGCWGVWGVMLYYSRFIEKMKMKIGME
jgi:hypothetical protein